MNIGMMIQINQNPIKEHNKLINIVFIIINYFNLNKKTNKIFHVYRLIIFSYKIYYVIILFLK